MNEYTEPCQNQAIVITNPMIAANKSAEVTLSKFLRILQPHYGDLLVMGGNVTVEEDLRSGKIFSVDIRRAGNKYKRATDIFLCQWKLARYVYRYAQKGMPVYFWVADKMLLPYWAAKGKQADIRYFLYGNVLKEGKTGGFQRLSARLMVYMANHADSVCVESLGVLDEWAGLVRPKRLRRIHLYAHTEEGLQQRKKQNVVGMLCRLTEGKHVLESIEAFAKFHEQHPSYTMEVIGSGKQETACQEWIRKLDAQDYISMKGWIAHQDVPKHTAHWKYLLFPSDTEGMPNSVVEMMGQGIPAIASPVGGIRDLIRHGENGFLLQSTAPEPIACALCDAVAEDARYEEISLRAWQTIKQKMSIQQAQDNAKLEI